VESPGPRRSVLDRLRWLRQLSYLARSWYHHIVLVQLAEGPFKPEAKKRSKKAERKLFEHLTAYQQDKRAKKAQKKPPI